MCVHKVANGDKSLTICIPQ